jgi:heme exporter protein D
MHHGLKESFGNGILVLIVNVIQTLERDKRIVRQVEK